MPAKYLRPYLKGKKNVRNAEAIAEAVQGDAVVANSSAHRSILF
jgi:hypothetical protein